MVSVSPTSLLQHLVPSSEWVGVSDMDLERWGGYMEANGFVFMISIIGVNVVQKLVSHFGHPLVEVIILFHSFISHFIQFLYFKVAREIHPQSLVANFFNTEFGLFTCPSESHANSLFDVLSPHLPHIHLPPAQTMDQSQFLYHWEESEIDHPDETLFGF